MWMFGSYWWLLIPGLILGLYAQVKLSSTYSRWMRVGTRNGLSGAEAAREILDHAGLQNVPVEAVAGHLTDHYDPGKRALFLSAENYEGRSVGAVGVAAHETGHALQHQAAYSLLNLRMALVPVTQIASVALMGLFALGLFLGGTLFSKFIWVAIAIFSILTFFQLVTLPVEFDASRRAKAQLLRLGLVQAEESPGVSAVLNAAALTYVAALVTAVMDLVRLLLIARDRD
jgi:Zn-dependent membrane protease YugP